MVNEVIDLMGVEMMNTSGKKGHLIPEAIGPFTAETYRQATKYGDQDTLRLMVQYTKNFAIQNAISINELIELTDMRSANFFTKVERNQVSPRKLTKFLTAMIDKTNLMDLLPLTGNAIVLAIPATFDELQPEDVLPQDWDDTTLPNAIKVVENLLSSVMKQSSPRVKVFNIKDFIISRQYTDLDGNLIDINKICDLINENELIETEVLTPGYTITFRKLNDARRAVGLNGKEFKFKSGTFIFPGTIDVLIEENYNLPEYITFEKVNGTYYTTLPMLKLEVIGIQGYDKLSDAAISEVTYLVKQKSASFTVDDGLEYLYPEYIRPIDPKFNDRTLRYFEIKKYVLEQNVDVSEAKFFNVKTIEEVSKALAAWYRAKGIDPIQEYLLLNKLVSSISLEQEQSTTNFDTTELRAETVNEFHWSRGYCTVKTALAAKRLGLIKQIKLPEIDPRLSNYDLLHVAVAHILGCFCDIYNQQNDSKFLKMNLRKEFYYEGLFGELEDKPVAIHHVHEKATTINKILRYPESTLMVDFSKPYTTLIDQLENLLEIKLTYNHSQKAILREIWNMYAKIIVE